MINLLNRKKQISGLFAALSAFVVLVKWTTPEIATAGGAVLMAVIALLSPDDHNDAPKELPPPGGPER